MLNNFPSPLPSVLADHGGSSFSSLRLGRWCYLSFVLQGGLISSSFVKLLSSSPSLAVCRIVVVCSSSRAQLVHDGHGITVSDLVCVAVARRPKMLSRYGGLVDRRWTSVYRTGRGHGRDHIQHVQQQQVSHHAQPSTCPSARLRLHAAKRNCVSGSRLVHYGKGLCK